MKVKVLLALLGSAAAIQKSNDQMVAVAAELNTSSQVYASEFAKLEQNERLVKQMMYSGDRNEAKKLVKQMRSDLVGLTQEMHMKVKEDPTEVKEISSWIENL